MICRGLKKIIIAVLLNLFVICPIFTIPFLGNEINSSSMGLAFAQTAEDYFQLGKTNLEDYLLTEAYNNFQTALTLPTANNSPISLSDEDKIEIIRQQREEDIELSLNKDLYDTTYFSQLPSATTGSCTIVSTIKAPDMDTDGLAWDAGNLWVSEGDLANVYKGTILKINTNGNILYSFKAPGQSFLGPGPEGLAFDGTYLWSVDYLDDKIYKLTTSGSVIGSIPAPSGISSGLTWDGNNLWVSEWFSYKIYKINPANGQILKSFNAPDSGVEYPYGLAWDGTHLWVSNSNGIYKIDSDTGSVLEACNDSEFKYGKAYGLTWDGQYLWAGGWIDDTIMKIAVPDTTPPDTSITGGPSGTITYNNPSFTYTGTDNVTPTANLVYATYLQGYEAAGQASAPRRQNPTATSPTAPILSRSRPKIRLETKILPLLPEPLPLSLSQVRVFQRSPQTVGRVNILTIEPSVAHPRW